MAKYIQNLEEIVDTFEKLKGYWDNTGLDLHIAVVELPMSTLDNAKTHVVVSTKHWSRVHYINVNQTSKQVWKHLHQISEEIGRKFIKSTKGKYVYINKLNIEQTQNIFNIFKQHFGTNIVRAWEMRWDINGSTFPN